VVVVVVVMGVMGVPMLVPLGTADADAAAAAAAGAEAGAGRQLWQTDKQRSRQTAAIGRALLLGFPSTLLERALAHGSWAVMDASGRPWMRMGLSNGQSRRLGSARRRRTRAHLSPLNHCKHTRPKLTIRYRRWWVRPLPVTAHEASNVAGCHCVHIMTSLSPARRPALVSRRRHRHGLAAETLTRCANMGKPSCVRRPVSGCTMSPSLP
jgi:hypothetical protein